MKSYFKPLAVSSLALVATASVTLSSVAQSTSGAGAPANAVGRIPTSCSAKTLLGTFGVTFAGTSNAQMKLNTLGIIRFYPNGQISGDFETLIGGGKSGGHLYTAKYTIFPDCRGVIAYSPIPGSQTTHFVVVDEGREILFLVDSYDWHVSGTGKRQ